MPVDPVHENFKFTVLALPISHLRAAASLRDLDGIEIAIDHSGQSIWLRAPHPTSERVIERFLALDATGRSYSTPEGSLVPFGKTVPADLLPPDLDWLPLSTSPPIQLPPPHTSAASVPKLPVRLVPTSKSLPASLLTCPFLTFYQWAIHAPVVRLSPLRFAASDSGDCAILGSPLPPVPGGRLSLRGNVACPLGFSWSPAVPPASLLASAGGRNSDFVAFLEPSRPPVLLAAELFLPVDRTSLRATARHLSSNGVIDLPTAP